VWLDHRGYLHGAPEFVCEIAASSASVDLHQKLRAYRRNVAIASANTSSG
jgi:Uma2 family endonuclease